MTMIMKLQMNIAMCYAYWLMKMRCVDEFALSCILKLHVEQCIRHFELILSDHFSFCYPNQKY